jgi:hypothetical protein
LRLCIGHILASETEQPQHQPHRTSALPSAAALSSHALPIVMTVADVFDALPALASTLVGWLLEYPIIYCLLSPHEVAAWGALLFENETPAAASISAQTCTAQSASDIHDMDLADCSQWWSRRGDPHVAALVAQTLARGGDRRHALSGTTAWLFEVYARASGGMEDGNKGRISIATSANQKDDDGGDARGDDDDDDDDDDVFASSMLRSRKPTKAAMKTPKSSKPGKSLPASQHAKRETDSEFCFSFSLPSAQCAAACRCIAGSDIKGGNDGDASNEVSEDEALARLLARYRASLAASASAHATALCINVCATRTLLEHVAL